MLNTTLKLFLTLIVLCIMISPGYNWSPASTLIEPNVKMTFNANGYLYVLNQDTVTYDFHCQYSKISSNGMLGAWQLVTSVNIPPASYCAAAASGTFVYVSGGININDLNGVMMAVSNANGTLSTFSSVSSLILNRQHHVMAAYNGYLYVLGGFNLDGPFSTQQDIYSVEYSKVSSNGKLSAWQDTVSLNSAHILYGVWTSNGYLWALGWDGLISKNLFLERTQMNVNGSLVGWQIVSTHPFTNSQGDLGDRTKLPLVLGSDGYVYDLYSLGSTMRTLPAANGTFSNTQNLEPLINSRDAVLTSYLGYLYALDGNLTPNDYYNLVEYRSNGVFIDKWFDMGTKPKF